MTGLDVLCKERKLEERLSFVTEHAWEASPSRWMRRDAVVGGMHMLHQRRVAGEGPSTVGVLANKHLRFGLHGSVVHVCERERGGRE